jgi:hypothetical protein
LAWPRQYAGITGQVENCVTTVFCSYVTPAGHCWVDWEPYLPEPWCQDTARRAAAGGPADIEFATKPELAARIVTRLTAGGTLTIHWVAAEETSHAVNVSSRCGGWGCLDRVGLGEGAVFVVVGPGGQAVVQDADEAVEQVALGGVVPVA